MLFEMTDLLCESGVMGKNNFIQLHKGAVAKQNLIHEKMNAVAKDSRLPGSSLILQVHKKARGTWHLRWRHKAGAVSIYLSWDDALKNILCNMNVEMTEHYFYLNNFAKELNTLDAILQKIITHSKAPYHT